MIHLDQIRSLVIEATSFCNLHCPQCARFDQEGFLNKFLTPGHLNFSNFKKNFDLCLLPNLEIVKFEGDYGDFLMHPQADDFLSLFDSIKDLQIITNGSLRSAQWWSLLSSKKNLTVTFSIDGLEDTNSIYRINSDFNKIINNAKHFIQSGGSAIWKYIVFEHNEHQIETARRFAYSLGFKDFLVKHTDRDWRTGNSWPVKIDGVYQYDIKPSQSVHSFNEKESTAAIIQYHRKVPKRPRCWLDDGHMYINHQGHVLPCCMTSGKIWQKNIISKLWQRLVGNPDDININLVPFNQIIVNNFYQSDLENSFTNSNTLHPSCSKCIPPN